MAAAAQQLPTDCETWDLSSYFPGLKTPEYDSFKAETQKQLEALRAEIAGLAPLAETNTAAFAKALVGLEALFPRFSHMSSYVNCLASANSRDEDAQAEQGRLAVLGSELSKLSIMLLSLLREATDAAFAKLCKEPAVADIGHRLRLMRHDAKFQMPKDLEMLNSELSIDGFSAWGRLYNQVAGKLEFTLRLPDGSTKTVPMAQRRGLLESPDPATRKSALVDGNVAWASMEDVAAACLNHIAGTRLTLYKRRGIGHFLDEALHGSSITKNTLEALIGAIEETVELPRRMMRLKAKVLGMKKLGFQDLSAPLPIKADSFYSWADGKQATLDAFAQYPRLHEYAARSFKNRWVESEPRNGKRPGAYCTSSYYSRESRVFMTYNGTLGDISTLAHELGHAFHNEVLKETRPYARIYPMTLAETASIFAETLLLEHMRKAPGTAPETAASVLFNQLGDAATFLMDIPMRFYFERALYEERAKGELPVSKLKQLMLDAQKKSFGDCLNEDELDPYFWASKLHFYITGVSFYNFPYTFGYLFSRALYAQYRHKGAPFFAQYEHALSLTGNATAEEVVREALGQDIEKPEFWKTAIVSLEEELKEFETMLAKGMIG